MTIKNFGPGTSPYLEVKGRNFETAVYQQSKPVLDSELNLAQDIALERSRSILQLAQSGWLAGDVLNTSSHSAGIFLPSENDNELLMPPMRALVNGWLINVENTGTEANNVLDLGAPPSGAGALRTDLVILEVWRRLLSGDSSEGKSQTGRIWRHGNVKIGSGDDLALNFADSILNANVGAETTKRVQIQYRLRVIQGVDIDAYASGIGDPTVAAFSVPASAEEPDGSVTAFGYVSQSPAGDGGLWCAGDGDPVNGLGTVDGYVYALPLVAVFRRNDAPFARDTNHNGGSGRPDGLSATIIDARDVYDVRTSVSPTGWDLQELLQKNVNWILDNALCTEHTTTPLGGGSKGHTVLWADEIGPTDNPGAQRIRHGFDGVCRTFSDRPILETVVVRYVPTDQNSGGAIWDNASVLTIDPTGATKPFRIYPHGSANFVNAAPTNVVILDVISWVGADTTSPGSFHGNYHDEATGASHGEDGGTLIGLGTAGPITLRFGFNAPSTDDLYVTLLVSYPGGNEITAGGLSRTPILDYGGSSVVVETPAQLPATAPYFASSVEVTFDYPHRELGVSYRTSTLTFSQRLGGFLNGGPATARPIYIPDRVALEPAPSVVNISTGQTYSGSITFSADGHLLFVGDQAEAWTPNGAPSFGDEVEVTYEAVRPIPNNGVQATIWYETRAPQAVRSASLGTSLTVIPRYVAPHMYVLVVGPGSLDEAYPFPSQYVQTPGVYPSSAIVFSGDHEMEGGSHVSIADFDAQTGFLQIPTLIPAVPDPQRLVLERNEGDVDIEGRAFFKSVPAGYVPSAFAQPLSSAKRHKNVLPMVAELAEDGPIGPRGSFVVLLLSRWAPNDAENKIGFDADLAASFTSASVYRLKGNPMGHRSHWA